MGQWYVVQAQSHSEAKAVHHLRAQGFETYLPRYQRIRRHARREELVAVPLFPGYFFVHLDLDQQRWRSVMSTIGVRRLVCSGDAPSSVPDSVIHEIQNREDENGLIKLDTGGLRCGDPVRIVDGPLGDCVGILAEYDDRQRVVLLLSLMGRNLRLTIGAEAVRPVA